MFEGKLKKVCKNDFAYFCLSDLFKKLVTQKLQNLERHGIANVKAYQIIYRLVPKSKQPNNKY